MSEFIITILGWIAPSIGTWVIAQIPSVRNWASQNWTKSVVIMTAVASFSTMGLGFYVYNVFIAPYVIICESANNCVGIRKDEISSIQAQSDATVTEIERVYTDGADENKINYHINATRDWAARTNKAITALSLKIKSSN